MARGQNARPVITSPCTVQRDHALLHLPATCRPMRISIEALGRRLEITRRMKKGVF